MKLTFFLKKLAAKGMLILILSIGFLFSYFIEKLQEEQHRYLDHQIKDETQAELSAVRSNLESAIYSDIYYANTLSTLITVNPSYTIDEWKEIAKEIYRDADHLRSIAVAPDSVIRFIYPIEENKSDIGLDFRTIPETWEAINIARKNEAIFMAGPLMLSRGGPVVIGRVPIFIDPPNNNEYWGSVSIVLELETLFKTSGVYELDRYYDVAIRGKNGLGKDGEFFYGEEETALNPTVIDVVNLPYGTWEISVLDPPLNELFPWYHLYSVRLVGYFVLCFMLCSFLVMYRLYAMANQYSLQDELTRLPNRRHFMMELDSLFARSKKSEHSFTLLNLDLERFKLINDTYGHVAGDHILKEVAHRLSNKIRSSDVAARVGGDEYLILLPRLNREEDIQKVIRNIADSINSEPVLFNDYTISIKTSIGYSCFHPDMASVDEMLNEADSRMYLNKNRDRYGDQ